MCENYEFWLQVTELLSKLDDLTKYIQQKLFENNLDQRVNVIHLSDHGMSSVTPPSFINLTDFVRTETVSFYGTSPVLQVVPKDSSELQSIRFTLTSIIYRNRFSLHYRFTRRDSCQSHGRYSNKWSFQGLHSRRFARTLAGGERTTNGSITRPCRYGIRFPRYVLVGRVVSEEVQCIEWVINQFDWHLLNQTTKYSRFQLHQRPSTECMDMTMRKSWCMQYSWPKGHWFPGVSKSNHSIRSICSIYFVGF